MSKFLNRLITFVALGAAVVIGATTVFQIVANDPGLSGQIAATSRDNVAAHDAPDVASDLSGALAAIGTLRNDTGTRAPALSDGYAPAPSPVADGVAALEAKDIPALASAVAAELARQGFVASEIKRNPGIVAEALVLWSRAQQGDTPEVKTPEIDPRLLLDALDGSAGVYVGPSDASFTAVEFFDPNCPYCRQSIPVVLAWIDQNPGVRVLFRELPVIAPQSGDAATVALALGQQGLYRAWLEAVATWNGGVIDGAEARRIARSVGADMDRLELAAASADTQKAIADNLALGAALGIDGTPAWVVGSSLLIGSTSLEWLTDFAAQQGAPLPEAGPVSGPVPEVPLQGATDAPRAHPKAAPETGAPETGAPDTGRAEH